MKIEVLIIVDDTEVIHRSVTTVDNNSNPFNVAIQAMINELTGHKMPPIVKEVTRTQVPYTNLESVPTKDIQELSLEQVKKNIAKDFGVQKPQAGNPTSFNIQALPSIKMSDVLKG